MPRVRGLSKKQKIAYRKSVLVDRCEILMKHAHVTKTDIANYLGVTQPAISYQFNTGNISIDTLIAVVTLTKAENEDICLNAEA